MPAHVEETARLIALIHAKHHQNTSSAQRYIERATALVGRPLHLGFMCCAVVAWIALNTVTPLIGLHSLDSPPFAWLELSLTLTALIVAVLILATQRRADELAYVREQMTLELAILTEQKVAKLIELVEEFRRDSPEVQDRIDSEAHDMATRADPHAILGAIKETDKEMRAATATLVLVFTFFPVAIATVSQVGASTPNIMSPTHYDVHRAEFTQLANRHFSIVLLGDSLVEYGSWPKLTGCSQIANMGIGGDTTAGVLARIQDVVQVRPRAVILEIGINDILARIPASATITNLRSIVDRLRAARIVVFMEHILPVRANRNKPAVGQASDILNRQITMVFANYASVSLLDERTILGDAQGHLLQSMTLDGLHLSAKGYVTWAGALKPTILSRCVAA